MQILDIKGLWLYTIIGQGAGEVLPVGGGGMFLINR
jgi:hypothetical protein